MQTRSKKPATRSKKAWKPKVKADNPSQSAAFIKKAREIEADEGRSDADELMKRLAKKPPKPRKPHG